MTFQLIFPFAISSHATLGGAPWLARVTQPGFRKQNASASFVSRNVRVPVQDNDRRHRRKCVRRIYVGDGISIRRAQDRQPAAIRKLLSQFPRTTVTRGPESREARRESLSAQTSPRCQISSASLAISLTFSGKRLWRVGQNENAQMSFDFSGVGMRVSSSQAKVCPYAPRRSSSHESKTKLAVS